MGSQFPKGFVVRVVHECDCTRSEETSLVQKLVVLSDFIHCKDGDQKVEDGLDVLVCEVVLVNTLTSHLEHHILEMELSKSLHFVSIEIVLLDFLWSFAVRKKGIG